MAPSAPKPPTQPPATPAPAKRRAKRPVKIVWRRPETGRDAAPAILPVLPENDGTN